MAGPLEGVRILDWTQWQAGPVSTAMMADLGAEVIHIENRITGDAGRGLTRRGMSTLPGGRSAYFECNNRGKKGITLDLTKEKGREAMFRLVQKSDVLVNNFRLRVAEKLGLDYETICHYNPEIIYVAISGYGPKGPDSHEPAYDYVALAKSGIMTMVGEPDMPPLPIFLGIADQLGAMMTAYGILAALVAKGRKGVGQKVDVSLLGALTTLQGLAIGTQLYTGREAVRQSRATSANALWNYYRCQDGKWLMLAAMHSEKYWPLVCRALGMGPLEKDSRFENAAKRQENCAELTAILDKIFLTRPVSEWVRMLRETGDIACNQVQTLAELTNDPQELANGYVVSCDHQALGPVKVVGIPIQLSKTPGMVRPEAPEFGQHTEEVLIEVGGYSWDEIAQLREAEVI